MLSIAKILKFAVLTVCVDSSTKYTNRIKSYSFNCITKADTQRKGTKNQISVVKHSNLHRSLYVY